jgi:hypothetical protein
MEDIHSLRRYQDRQCAIIETQARSCNHCCSGKAISITYSVCVFVALGIKDAMRMRHVICGLSGSIVFFHIMNGTIVEKALLNITYVFRFSHNFCLKYFSF